MMIFRRHLMERVERLLSTMPAVFLQGARQVGKSTLAKQLMHAGVVYDYLSLDDPLLMDWARRDVVGFVRALRKGSVIDEVQRVPELMLAIKMRIDEHREAGIFLLTGSANPLMLPQVSDALVGRMGIATLMPLSQGEIEEVRETWLDQVFEREPTMQTYPPIEDLPQRLVRGCYPEAVLRRDDRDRREWLLAYINMLITRDVRDLSEVEHLTRLPQLLKLLAAHPCQILNIASLSRELGLAQATLHRYMSLFEALFIVERVPAWYANIGKRLLKSPKILLNDTGLVAVLASIDAERLSQEREIFGRLLENFVGMELLKQIRCAGLSLQLYHFRTDKGVEVDYVLEDGQGRLVGVEVKASATLTNDDFRAMRAFQAAVGARFVCGVVLYNGERAVPFGEALWAIPIQALWNANLD